MSRGGASRWRSARGGARVRWRVELGSWEPGAAGAGGSGRRRRTGAAVGRLERVAAVGGGEGLVRKRRGYQAQLLGKHRQHWGGCPVCRGMRVVL